MVVTPCSASYACSAALRYLLIALEISWEEADASSEVAATDDELETGEIMEACSIRSLVLAIMDLILVVSIPSSSFRLELGTTVRLPQQLSSNIYQIFDSTARRGYE